jgi:hypothetical protein
MKKKFFGIAGLLAMALVFGLIVTGCDENADKDNNDSGAYHLQVTITSWGGDYDAFKSTMLSSVSSYAETGDDLGSGYVTGAAAKSAYDIFTDSSSSDINTDGSFENLLNFSKDGIGAPPKLKAALAAKKGSVPLFGLFYTDIGEVPIKYVVFYITKN